MTSVNACFCSRLHLNLFCHSETAVSHLNGPRHDCRQVQAPNNSYAWLLLVQLHVQLDLHGFGWILPSSCIISLCNRTRKKFLKPYALRGSLCIEKVANNAEISILQVLQFQETRIRIVLPGGTCINITDLVRAL
jgi:hypothetical protein